MSVCPYCGAEVAEGATLCNNCFNTIDGTSTIQNKKIVGARKPLIAVIALLVVAAVILALLFWCLSPSKRLDRSIQKTTDALSEQITKQEQLKNLANTLEDLSRKRKFEASVKELGDTDGFTANFCYDGRGKKMEGSLSLDGIGNDAAFFYMDRNALQFQIPAISSDVYRVSLKDLKKKLGKSIFSNIIGSESIKGIPLDFFDNMNNRTKGFYKTWKSFWKTVKVETRDKRGDYTVYHVTWNMQDLAKLLQNGEKGLIGPAIMKQLRKLDGDCVCSVDKNGFLRQAELMVGGDILTIELLGEDNPWTTFQVVSTIKGSALLKGGVEADGTKLHIDLQADNNEPIIDISYNNMSDDFLLCFPGFSARGKMSGDKDSSQIIIDQTGKNELQLQLGRLGDRPERLAKKPIDLLDMNATEAGKLLIQIGANQEKVRECINQLVEFFQIILYY